MSLRAFVAVPVATGPLLAELLDTVAHCGADVKCPEAKDLHVTLDFLGDVPDDAPERIRAALGRAARHAAPFTLQLHGAGAFPSAQRPRVVWAGAREGAGALEALAARVRTELAAEGVRGDAKPFKTHVTLGRVKSTRSIERLVEVLAARRDTPLEASRVQDVRLYRSTLTPQGAVYEALAIEPLAGVA